MKTFAIIVACILIAGCSVFIVFQVYKIIKLLIERRKQKKQREKGNDE